MRRWGRFALAGATCFASLALVIMPAAPAWADQTITSPGPLTSIGTTSDLNCSVNHAGDTSGEWFSDTSCGTFVAVGGTLFGPATITAGGNLDVPNPHVGWTAVSQTTSGNGTAATPASITSVVNGGSAVQVTQLDSYVFGQESYLTTVTVKNVSASPESLVLYRAGDCFLANSDNGFGRIDTVTAGKAPTCVGVDPVSGGPGARIEQLLPLTPGSSFVEDNFSQVWADLATQNPLPNICGQCDQNIDNGAALSWSLTLAAGASQSFSELATFSPAGQTPIIASKTADAATAAPSAPDGYTVNFHNGNATAATLTSIADTLPTGFTYMAGTTSGGITGDPTIAGSQLTWTGPFTVPAAGDLHFHFSVTVSPTAGHFTNSVTGASAASTVAPAIDTAPIDVSGTAVTTTTVPGGTTTTVPGGTTTTVPGGTTTTVPGGTTTTTLPSTTTSSTTSTTTVVLGSTSLPTRLALTGSGGRPPLVGGLAIVMGLGLALASRRRANGGL